MKYISIDTETNGIFDYKLPADDPSQPRLAHLAMIFLDENGVEESRSDYYVCPDGWKMTEGATAANGLTDEFLAEVGQPVSVALDAYEEAIRSGRGVIAFNAQFDCKQMRGEFRRAGRDDLFTITNNICVMRPMVSLCGLKQEGSNRAKWPKLGEALAHFGHVQQGAHQAVNDAEGAAILFRELRSRSLLKEASVHYAKPGGKADEARKKKKATPATKAAVGGNFPDSF